LWFFNVNNIVQIHITVKDYVSCITFITSYLYMTIQCTNSVP
jgi:hypothetical protein